MDFIPGNIRYMYFLFIWARPSIMVHIVFTTVAIKKVQVGLGCFGVSFSRATDTLCNHALMRKFMLVDIGNFSKWVGVARFDVLYFPLGSCAYSLRGGVSVCDSLSIFVAGGWCCIHGLD